ncbi:hypothetical protein M758_8G124000 [Ceratodon purpureus]|uniref:Uncharacterized protein n=1 Tax=Ceratodon purpureus TaxID=3225 RepID=A0A8T0H3J1_CERPU|nr:hypothetical protein KC19_8G129900 [Ceratodon purpureus]KAG0564668.1 hypothetical protein KC19_8G129900 [Ceratodon purpureus]KAG0608681.1 hypothetical protein M758_8G124000 [Ceratodon purpureus]
MRALRHRMADDKCYCRPRRIVLVRHGESEGNVDAKKYCHIADPKIRLTEAGTVQAQRCGQIIREIIGKEVGEGGEGWRVFFYVSPYMRTLSTLKEIGKAFEKQQIEGVREEPRIREQDFGNFQEHDQMQAVKDIRERFGRFFYRFPEGESVADVFDRVTSFLESLWRDIEHQRLSCTKSKEMNLVIISHGTTMRVFLMRWFRWTTEQFENLINPLECEVRVMQLGDGGEYSLLVHHTQEELQQWGLSPDMILDQEFRKTATRGEYSEEWPWSGTQFFDHFNETEAGGGNDERDGDNGAAQENTNGESTDAQTPLDMLALEESADGDREPDFPNPASR